MIWRCRTGAVCVALFTAAVGFAQTEAPRFRFERPVRPGAAGANRLAVDVPLLAGAAALVYAYSTSPDGAQRMLPMAGLEDLRLYDGDGDEVAYRVVWAPRDDAPVRVPIAFAPVGESATEARLRLPLPGRGLPVSAIVIVVRDPMGGRSVQVGERRAALGSSVTLGAGILTAGVEGARHRIGITRPQSKELELSAEGAEPFASKIDSIEAELAPLPWIYFESETGGELTARFGVDRLGPPRYELAIPEAAEIAAASWGERREVDAPVRGVVLPVRPVPRSQPVEADRVSVVAMVAALVVALLLVAYGLLRRARRRHEPKQPEA